MPVDHERLNAAQTSAETDPFTPWRYRHLVRRTGAPRRILDVGCGTGRGGVVLRERFPDARIDGVELLADRAARIPGGIYDSVTIGDLSTLVGGNPRYEALVLAELVEHVPYDGLDHLLQDARALLAPGGRLLLTTPNPHALRLRLRHGSVLGGAHVSVHCPAALAQLVAHHGFRVLRVEGTGRVSRLLGTHLPLGLYGSYLLAAAVVDDPVVAPGTSGEEVGAEGGAT